MLPAPWVSGWAVMLHPSKSPVTPTASASGAQTRNVAPVGVSSPPSPGGLGTTGPSEPASGALADPPDPQAQNTKPTIVAPTQHGCIAISFDRDLRGGLQHEPCLRSR